MACWLAASRAAMDYGRGCNAKCVDSVDPLRIEKECEESESASVVLKYAAK